MRSRHRSELGSRLERTACSLARIRCAVAKGTCSRMRWRLQPCVTEAATLSMVLIIKLIVRQVWGTAKAGRRTLPLDHLTTPRRVAAREVELDQCNATRYNRIFVLKCAQMVSRLRVG